MVHSMTPLEALASLERTNGEPFDERWLYYINEFMQRRFPGDYDIVVDKLDENARLRMVFKTPYHETVWILRNYNEHI